MACCVLLVQIVARQVVAEAEKSKEEVAATYRQRWEAEQAALQAETEGLKQVGTAGCTE